MEGRIYHITRRVDWEAASQSGAYTAPSLASQGFIHCSYARQVERVANHYYPGQTDLILLVIDPLLLASSLKVEKAVDVEDDYPHIYGPINLDAVLKIVELSPSPDLRFHLSAGLL